MVNKREVSGKAGGRLSTEREGGGPRANEATYPAGMGFRRGETREVKGRPGCSGRGERGRHEAVSPSQSSTGVGGGGGVGTRTPQDVAHTVPALNSRSDRASAARKNGEDSGGGILTPYPPRGRTPGRAAEAEGPDSRNRSRNLSAEMAAPGGGNERG